MEEMNLTVGEFRAKLNSIFHDIIPENVANRCLKELSKIVDNDDFTQRRVANKESVDKLIEQICHMQNMPFHKIQTVFRKSSAQTQLFFLERVVTLDSWYKDTNQNIVISVPTDFAGFVRYVLIDLWADKMKESNS